MIIYVRGPQTFFCEGHIIFPFSNGGPGRSVTKNYIGQSDDQCYCGDSIMILNVFIMPPNARLTLVYYFVMHCTDKWTLLFKRYIDLLKEHYYYHNDIFFIFIAIEIKTYIHSVWTVGLLLAGEMSNVRFNSCHSQSQRLMQMFIS